MKRLLLTAAAVLTIAGPLAVPAFAQQGRGQPQQLQGGPQGYQQGRDNDRGGDRDWGRDNDRNDRDGDRGRNNDRGRDHRQMSQYHDSHTAWRDTRRNARWNQNDHNGYYIGRSWHSGQPSSRDYNRRGFVLAYRPWQRGDELGSYNNRYREVDYRDYRDQRLQRPPQGYRWVEDDNSGDLILAAIAGGLIAAIITGR